MAGEEKTYGCATITFLNRDDQTEKAITYTYPITSIELMEFHDGQRELVKVKRFVVMDGRWVDEQIKPEVLLTEQQTNNILSKR